MGSIPSVYSTGINDFYNPLNVGSLDFHYTLTPPSVPWGTGVNATATDITGTGWAVPVDNARWISIAATPGTNQTTQDYWTAFNLDRFDSSTAEITGTWQASGTASMHLNGQFAGSITGGTVSPFTLNSGFTPGINWLQFTVATANGNNGLLVSMTGTASPVPEPSAIVSLGVGLIMAAIGLKWRKQLCRKSITPTTPV